MDGETSGLYRRFAEFEARGSSSCYELWALGIASDPELVGLIDQLPLEKRQPNLVLTAARFLGVGEVSFAEFRAWVGRHWDALVPEILTRRTQTNEVGRASVLLPVLAQLPGPLALIEVGASAGLCLYPDLFSYRYDDRIALDPIGGVSDVELRCATTGEPPVPGRLPEVVWRAGVDLNPLDVTDTEQMRWLEYLVWPGQPERLQRLRAAVTIAQRQPVGIKAGDLNETVAELVSAAPAEATVVVFHSAVLAYLSVEERDRFERMVRGLRCHWVSNEGCSVIGSIAERLPVPASETPGRFVVALDGVPLGYAGAHGQSLDWFAPALAW
ncbi:DUF2332 domain-containing protein [Nocardia acidivorans]|uniref:DUF2332 domain-containing protein n=1 Tax=Nocardia acidivorans TaxID=404580 RepID=UPI00082C90ED|nr:DUF2332 domain-containing protein [Nocardia acidivorans]